MYGRRVMKHDVAIIKERHDDIEDRCVECEWHLVQLSGRPGCA